METFEYDVVIIGGGPAGCTCALYTARSGLRTVILDKNPSAGALAITHKIANYPGVRGEMTGSELLDWMREQAVEFGAVYQRAQVFRIEIGETEKKVYTPEGIFMARTLVLASGAMGRTPSIPGEAKYLGRGVSYCATCDAPFYREREVAVIGMSEEAIAEAQVLAKFASTVHWIAPKDTSRLNGAAEEILAHPATKLWSKTRLQQIQGNDTGVTAIELLDMSQKTSQMIPVEGVFIYLQGAQPITDFLNGQVILKPDGGVQVDAMMQTNVPGVWAIGDIRNTPFKQAVVAAADGCIAAMAIDQFLNQRKGIKPDWGRGVQR
ncbi:MAG: Thioredoxin reductase [Chroococcidiopsis sp. SAG 2025]|uniref:NAD(P)/FAD-dependent oxidoreductase n=1 Tax=Chroococcidiopsis sp. SAG 2025 TaxID=171389 RepID=UPI0029374061|nr:FAD-dependent oxidoreductase [Chroococcidiopsis sp. SAG 2025]MDV2997036.1 Thioredoxin reductase [Chroococcidiopsis sp. SAG 2025]